LAYQAFVIKFPDDAFGGMILDVDDRKINIRERYAKGC
jgi:hypothetical protein